MATLRGLVTKFGQRPTARLFAQAGTPHSESSIRAALKNPKGKGYAKLNQDARAINIRTARPPTEGEFSSTRPVGHNAPREVKVLFGRRTGYQVGRPDSTDKKGRVKKYAALSKVATDNLILKALEAFGPDTTWSIAFFGSVYAEAERGSDVSLELHDRWITVTAPGRVVYTQAVQITSGIAVEREDIANFVTDPKELAKQRREIVGDYARRLAEALTPYQWQSVRALWIAPAKTFQAAG